MPQISDYLVKVNEDFTISMYDNGFLFTISGYDDADDWKQAKIVCSNIDELLQLINEATSLPRN